MRWIKNWNTLRDLNLINEWTYFDNIDWQGPNFINNAVVLKDGTTIKISDFHEMDGIHTQGTPGT